VAAAAAAEVVAVAEAEVVETHMVVV